MSRTNHLDVIEMSDSVACSFNEMTEVEVRCNKLKLRSSITSPCTSSTIQSW